MTESVSRAYQVKRFLRLLADNKALRRAPSTWVPLWKLIGAPRYTPTVTHILGPRFVIVDAASFVSAYIEIFVREIYRFISTRPDPYIIDCGANVGVSVCYFKQLYPDSIVTAFEPDVTVFQALARNVHEFGLNDVSLQNEAVWVAETTLNFRSEGADAGMLTAKRDSTGPTMTVPAVALRDYLNRHVDFLKMDIEGAEIEVLTSCRDLLHNVERLFVEYHSFADRPQELDALFSLLTGAGFRLHVHSAPINPQPFVTTGGMPRTDSGMDMRLNIFAFREVSPVDSTYG